jgi:hypothetical protein
MANKSVKKPQSLNDSHYRFLQDLSAPPKTSSKPLADENDTPIQPRNLIYQDVDDDTIPQFSAITDFDSPIGTLFLFYSISFSHFCYILDLNRISFCLFHFWLIYVNLLLGQNSPENIEPVRVEEAPIRNEVPRFSDNCSLSKCFVICFTWIDFMFITLIKYIHLHRIPFQSSVVYVILFDD